MIPLLSTLESRLVCVEVMSLERLEMVAKEETEFKKTKREIMARILVVEGGLWKIYNETTVLEIKI